MILEDMHGPFATSAASSPVFLSGVHNAELFQSWNEGRMFSVSIRHSTRAHWRGNSSCREDFSRR
jgi:hypothetical protein